MLLEAAQRQVYIASMFSPCQSRWGFHTCDRETFLKLRYIARSFFQAQKDSAKWRRWNAKTINKTGPAPYVNTAFVVLRRYEKKQSHGVIGGRWNPLPVSAGEFLSLYQEARTPRRDQVSTLDSAKIDAINSMYARVAKENARRDSV